jgi:signal peptidase II
MPRRIALVVWIGLLVALGWWAKLAADAALAGGAVIDLGLLRLQLVHNSGVAFSMGAGLPTGVVLAATGAITAGAAGYAWWSARTLPLAGLAGLGGVVAGALTNLADRAADGVVTDYLHTGWFATFNVPDSLITGGAVLFVLAMMWPERS